MWELAAQPKVWGQQILLRKHVPGSMIPRLD